MCWDKRRGKWRVTHKVANRQHHIGHFDTEEEAARAAEAWRAEHMPYSNN